MPTRLHTGPATRAPTMWESQIVVPACHDVSPDRRGEQAVEPKNGSVVRRRQLALQLKLLRERAGLTIEEAAPALDWSASKLSRIENAQQAVDVHWVRSMLDVYQVSGDEWPAILDLCRESRQRGWWRAYGLGDDAYVGFENEATEIFDFTISYVPGLLQI